MDVDDTTSRGIMGSLLLVIVNGIFQHFGKCNDFYPKVRRQHCVSVLSVELNTGGDKPSLA